MHVCNRPHNVRIASETIYKQYKSMFTSKDTYKMATKIRPQTRANSAKKYIGVNHFSANGSAKSGICIAVIKEHN